MLEPSLAVPPFATPIVVFDLPGMVIFPGWVQHHVHADRGERPRICVSCNLTMEVA